MSDNCDIQMHLKQWSAVSAKSWLLIYFFVIISSIFLFIFVIL